MNIGAWIKQSRLSAGMTQDVFGDALGVGKANVSSWERGHHRASYAQLLKIAAVTKCTIPTELENDSMSPLALDLARALDGVSGDKARKIAYAMCLNAIQMARLHEPDTQPQQPMTHHAQPRT